MLVDQYWLTRKRARRILFRPKVRIIFISTISISLLLMSRFSSTPTPAVNTAGGHPAHLYVASAAHPFSSCLRLHEDRWFDVSLTQGAGSAEVRARPAARQPRDAALVWDAVRTGFWHGNDGPVPLTDVTDGDMHLLRAAAAAALTEVRRAADEDARVSITSVATRTSHLGVQFAMTASIRRDERTMHRVATLSAPPGGRCTISMMRARPPETVYVVMPYAARPRLLRSAVARLVAVARRGVSMHLIIAAREAGASFASQVANSANVYVHGLARVVSVGGGDSGAFSRPVAIRDALRAVPPVGLVFFADVDMAVNASFFSQCRANAVLGSQAWFPVVFSLYPYGRRVRRGDGYWRGSGYGMACMFRSDFDAVGGFGGGEEHRYQGWGGEDIDLYSRFRENPRYAVLRSREPALVHIWHGKHCEHNANYAACMRTIFLTSASPQRLAAVFAKSDMPISQLMKV